MEKDSVGYARSVRSKKAEPTLSENLEFKLMTLAMSVLLGTLYFFAIMGATMFFWRVLG